MNRHLVGRIENYPEHAFGGIMQTNFHISGKSKLNIDQLVTKIAEKRHGLLMLLSGLSIAAIAASAPAHAQDDLLNTFSNEMKTKALKEPVDGLAIPVKNNLLSSGYYRIVLEEKFVPVKLKYTDCRKDFESIPDSKFLDVLFDKKFDAGLAVILPLGLKGLDGKEATAELNLIHWKRGINNECSFAPSNFQLIPDRKYAGPWATIDHDSSEAIKTNVTFRPWIIKSENSERKAAFWTGISAVASLFGPVGKLLFAGESDKYSIRSQAELSLFGGKSGVNSETATNSEAGKFLGPTLIVKPDTIATGSAPKSRSFSLNWEAAGEQAEGPAAEKKSFQYNFSIEYLGSLFGAGEHYPDFSNAAQLQGILRATIKPASLQTALGKSKWEEVEGALGNLREQTTTDAFQAACNPAKSQLTDLGVSEDDALILTLAIAKFSDHQTIKKGIANIKCLTDARAQKTLARFGVPFNFYQPLESGTLKDAIKRSRKTWSKEAKWEQEGILDLMNGKAIIYDENSLIGPATSPAFSSSIAVDESQLRTAISAATSAKFAACSLSTLAENKTFQFPDTPSGDEPKSGWIIHLLEGANEEAFLVASGFAGQRTKPGATEASAVLSHIWFGKPADLDKDIWSNIKTALVAKGPTDGCGRNSFKNLIAYQHPAEQVDAPTDVAPIATQNTPTPIPG